MRKGIGLLARSPLVTAKPPGKSLVPTPSARMKYWFCTSRSGCRRPKHEVDPVCQVTAALQAGMIPLEARARIDT
jgi:hypothetical protein